MAVADSLNAMKLVPRLKLTSLFSSSLIFAFSFSTAASICSHAFTIQPLRAAEKIKQSPSFPSPLKQIQIKPKQASIKQKPPRWVPYELIELASDDHDMSPSQFIKSHCDVEAYTSCDDDGDEFHECDFLRHYLGPTKWVRLAEASVDSDGKNYDSNRDKSTSAEKSDEKNNKFIIDKCHLSIWKDVWSHPHPAVDLADKVSKDCLR